MATITFTKSEQTTKSETSSVIIKSSEHKTNQNSENSAEINDSKMKKNKNANLRKSKSAQSCENLETKHEEPQAKDQHAYETQVSKAEVDCETDSAIGSSNYSCMSLDSLLSNFDDQLDLEETRPKVCEEAKGSDYRSPSFSSSATPPFYYTPKVPVPTATEVYDVKRKVKFKQNRIQPVPEKPEFQSHLSDQRVPEQTEIDGERSLAQYLRVNPELSEESSLASSITASSLSSCSRRGMSDFVILHTDDDLEAAGSFMEHLQRDIGIPDLSVDLLSNIDAGKPGMQSLATLHDNYRYILTYVTKNLESDKYCRYLDEIVLTLGLREANGKEERVVPVLTRQGYCNIIELSILGGLQYFNFRSRSTLMSDSYVNCVKNLVKTGRAKFP